VAAPSGSSVSTSQARRRRREGPRAQSHPSHTTFPKVEPLARRIPMYRDRGQAAVVGVTSDAPDELKAEWRAIAAGDRVMAELREEDA
jgi:hypothetical protein